MILHVGDKFGRIVDVMNNCFGWNYKACMKGYYCLNPDKKTYAWFPKLADLSAGIPKPGDKWYGWCNTMSADGKYIYMNNFENPELVDYSKEITGVEPTITFVKYPGEKQYTFVGVYTHVKADKELGCVNERIAEDIDTKMYL